MTDVVLDTPLQRMRGAIGRYPEEGQRYVFEYPRQAPTFVHMVGVRGPLEVTWVSAGPREVTEVLEPWTGFACHEAHTVVEERP
jgi:uncharacterized membrane protein (UPF0127 family)